MRENRSRLLNLWFLAVTFLLVACSGSDPSAAPPEPAEMTPLATAEATQPLPPPPVATVPATGFEVPQPEAIDPATAATTMLSPESLPPEVQSLIADIQQGDFPVGQPVSSGPGVQATYTYTDVDRDGNQDLVVIVVADQGGLAGVSAGRLAGSPVIRLAPFPGSESGVQAMDIPVEMLVELAQANGTNPDGTYILTLTADPAN